jgi:hypothetical protein
MRAIWIAALVRTEGGGQDRVRAIEGCYGAVYGLLWEMRSTVDRNP